MSPTTDGPRDGDRSGPSEAGGRAEDPSGSAPGTEVAASKAHSTPRTRPYRMTERAKAVERTRDGILQAAYDLWLEHPYDEMTLESIADRAGVSRQTVYRHFGTKDELAQAVMAWRQPLDAATTARLRPGDVPAAVEAVVSRYETAGDAYVRTLHMADRVPAVEQMLEGGREAHRAWVAHAFGPYLPLEEGERREEAILTLYAATDVMVWKLLRRDFGRSRAHTEDIVRTLVEGALRALSTSPEEET